MRILITQIALSMPDRIIPEGEVVEGVELAEGEALGENQIPLEIATARLAAGTAEPVIDGVTSISPAVAAVTAQIATANQALVAARAAFLDAAEAGTDSDKLALAEVLKGFVFGGQDQADRIRDFEDQVDAIRAGLAKKTKPPKAEKAAS
jgi:hypothetical protein